MTKDVADFSLVAGNRSAFINLTDENVRTLTDRWEVVYSYDAP